MAIIRWTDRTPLWPRRTIASLFDDPFFANSESVDRLVPATDISENDKEIVLTAELPGMSAEDVKVSVDNDVLSISGEKKSENETEDECCHCSERRFGSFDRRFTLPDTVDRDKITAKSENGVLRIVLPKVEKAKPKNIKVKVN